MRLLKIWYKFFGVTRAFGYNVEVYRNAETFTRARVCPSPAPYPQDDLVVPDGEACNVCNFHKAFGFKMGIIAQRFVHPLVKADVDFRSCLCNSRYREVI